MYLPYPAIIRRKKEPANTGQDSFISLGSCSPANLPIAKGSKIRVHPTGWLQTGNEAGAFIYAGSKHSTFLT